MTEDDLEERAAAFQRCIEERDADAAEAVLHEDSALVLVHRRPALMPRARWLEVLADYDVHEYRVEERCVDVAGEVPAVLQRAVQRATVLSEGRSGTLINEIAPLSARPRRYGSSPVATGRSAAWLYCDHEPG